MDCPLCLARIGEGEVARYFELSVCRSCKSGNVALPLQQAGRKLVVHLMNPGSDNEKHPSSILAIGALDSFSMMKVRASRRGLFTGLVEGIFGKVRTGDDVFDEHVWIRSDRSHAAIALLSRESVRASLLECTAGGTVSIRGGDVRCLRASPGLGHQDVNETARGMLVLMHYVRGI